MLQPSARAGVGWAEGPLQVGRGCPGTGHLGWAGHRPPAPWRSPGLGERGAAHSWTWRSGPVGCASCRVWRWHLCVCLSPLSQVMGWGSAVGQPGPWLVRAVRWTLCLAPRPIRLPPCCTVPQKTEGPVSLLFPLSTCSQAPCGHHSVGGEAVSLKLFIGQGPRGSQHPREQHMGLGLQGAAGLCPPLVRSSV